MRLARMNGGVEWKSGGGEEGMGGGVSPRAREGMSGKVNVKVNDGESDSWRGGMNVKIY